MAFFTVKGFGREYAAGLKNGIAISAKNREKKFHALSVKRYLEIQLELYKKSGEISYKSNYKGWKFTMKWKKGRIMSSKVFLLVLLDILTVQIASFWDCLSDMS